MVVVASVRLRSNDRFPEKPADRCGSASAGRSRDLTARKLTPKLSDRIADVRGRQYPTHCGSSA